jgi:hypothetical protein
MKKFFLSATIAVLAITTSASAAVEDINLPSPFQEQESVLLQGITKVSISKVDFYISKEDGVLISKATLPNADGLFLARLNNVPCETTVHFRAIAKGLDGRKIKSKWTSYTTSKCARDNSYARYNPVMPNTQ